MKDKDVPAIWGSRQPEQHLGGQSSRVFTSAMKMLRKNGWEFAADEQSATHAQTGSTLSIEKLGQLVQAASSSFVEPDKWNDEAFERALDERLRGREWIPGDIVSPEIDSENAKRGFLKVDFTNAGKMEVAGPDALFNTLNSGRIGKGFDYEGDVGSIPKELISRGAYQLGTGSITMPNKITPKISLKNKVEDSVLFKIQNVHDYYERHGEEHGWLDPNAFSCVRLPFDSTVFSYDHTFFHPRTREPILRHITVAMHAFKRNRVIEDILRCQLSDQDTKELLHIIDRREPDSFISTRFVMDDLNYPGTWHLMLDETGHPLTDEVHGQNWLWIRDGAETAQLERFRNASGSEASDAFWKQGMICLTALQFLNCKNVEIVDNPPSRQQRRFAERQRQKPPVTYKTLVIHPMGRRRHGATESGDSEGAKRALHIVRGHFKDYKEKGLGRAHTRGVFWWSAQVRGSAEHGRVEKDYEVEAEA